MHLISPSFLAVADPMFLATFAVFEPASLKTVLVAAAPELSLLYLTRRREQNPTNIHIKHSEVGTLFVAGKVLQSRL